jgi:tRNA A-37 threonylcarbamoyl transferase component Bud32
LKRNTIIEMKRADTKTLVIAGRNLELPATMNIRMAGREDLCSLELHRLFRVLPGKRIVALARCEGRDLVVKLFFAKGRWQHHVERELRGIQALQAADIPTPELIATGSSDDGACGVVLMQYLQGSESIGACWSRSDRGAALALLHHVVALVARCHDRGLVQKDIHLDNFLLQGEQLYLLDAAALEQYSGERESVDSVTSLRNLALLLAQFPAGNDVHADALYEHYRTLRSQLDIGSDLELFTALIRKKRIERLTFLRGKLYRETSANACLQTWSRFAVYQRDMESQELQQILCEPETLMTRGNVIKAGNSSTVVKLKINGRVCVLKRYNLKNHWHRVRRLLRPSRAWVCWGNAHMLEMLGVETARPLLMLERRFGPLRKEAYFLSMHAAGDDALQFLGTVPVDSPALDRVLGWFQELFILMQRYQIVHGDMKASNFLVGGTGLIVLDLDGMHQEFDPRRFAVAHGKDLQRFAKNWQSNTALTAKVQAMLGQVLAEFDVT